MLSLRTRFLSALMKSRVQQCTPLLPPPNAIKLEHADLTILSEQASLSPGERTLYLKVSRRYTNPLFSYNLLRKPDKVPCFGMSSVPCHSLQALLSDPSRD